jgi:hypothetical protein
VHQHLLAYEQQQMQQPQQMLGHLVQHFAQNQQQNLGMGSMNGMDMGGTVTGMQNMENMQHRYPGEMERPPRGLWLAYPPRCRGY